MKTPEAKVLQAVRDLAPSIADRAAEIESARRLPLDLVDQLKQAGVFRMFVPTSHGGDAVDLRAGLETLEVLSRADGSTGWTAMIGAESPHIFALLPRDRFDAIYSSGPDVICGGAFNVQGEARVVDGGYRASGRWGFASGSQHCDWLFANCVVIEDGRPRPGAAPGMPETRAMVYRAGDVQILDTWSVLGLRGTGSHDIAVEDAFCPAESTVDIFQGVATVESPAFVAPVLHCAIHMAAVATGIAQGAVDDVIAHATAGRKRLYARAPLSETPLFQQQLGRATTTLASARAALYTLGEEFWQACVGAPQNVPAIAPRISATLAWIGEASMQVVDTCFRAAGASAIRDGSTLQRRFRDIHTFGQHAAVAEGFFVQAGIATLGQPTGFFT